MKYKSIEKWLEKCPMPEMFDFVEDTQDIHKISGATGNYGEINDIYQKFFIYKFNASEPNKRPNWRIVENIKMEEDWKEKYPNEDWKEAFRTNIKEFLEEAKKYEGIDDPDASSSLLQAVYKSLWPELANKSFMIGEDRIYSDTMTSAMTRFSDAMKLFINETHPKETELSPEMLKIIRKIRSIHKACGRQNWWSINFSIIVIACLGEEDRKTFYELIESEYPALPRFLDICHTPGNYCPVPGGFNGARSGKYADHDYWDLTLMKIRDWYRAADKMPMYERDQLLSRDLLHNKGNALSCMRWLECFGQGEIGWHNFVNTLLMQDHVYDEDDEDHPYYDVKPFWSEHGWGEGKTNELPKNTEEFNQALEKICSRIEARSNKIVNACRSKIRSQKAEKK